VITANPNLPSAWKLLEGISGYCPQRFAEMQHSKNHRIMEEVIQTLLRRVIGEVLTPCGLSNRNDELLVLNDGIAHISRIGE
jgi:hypothetical protein